jgi:mannose-1-phosphate guanylyltransferase
MAGGEGTRFAPLSTPERPKQFLNMVGSETFIQQTRRRVAELVEPENIYVATNERYVGFVRNQLSDIPDGNIIPEPVKRNTAPCIAYSARLIQSRDPEAVIVVLPSDHVILEPQQFVVAVGRAVRVAVDNKKLVTLGITPKWPATEYGYIKAETLIGRSGTGAFSVKRFVEKPDLLTARRYIQEGGFYWNSGMFIWTAENLLTEVAAHLPEMHELLADFNEGD